MNLQQTKYALGRVDAIERARLSDAAKSLTRPAVRLSPQERLALLKSGRVALSPKLDGVDWATRVFDAFDFSQHEDDGSPRKEDLEPLVAAIRAQGARLRDQIMLGEAEEALALILAFEKGDQA